MPKTKSRHNGSKDTYDTRLAAAQSLTLGDRVRHKVNGRLGIFLEINLGFALPEVWVQFSSDIECSVPVSCNPLDLELVPKDCLEHPTPKDSAMQETYGVQDSPTKDETPLQVPIGTCENSLLVENQMNGTELPRAVDVLPKVMTEVQARLPDKEQQEEVEDLCRAIALSNSSDSGIAASVDENSDSKTQSENACSLQPNLSQPIRKDSLPQPDHGPGAPPSSHPTDTLSVSVQWDGIQSQGVQQTGELDMESNDAATADSTPALSNQSPIVPEVLEELADNPVCSSLTAKFQVPIGTCENFFLVENRTKQSYNEPTQNEQASLSDRVNHKRTSTSRRK
jgi:hypothetical protein